MATENDKAVLNCIFNPLMPIGDYNQTEDQVDHTLKDVEEESNEVKSAKELELEGVKAAEKGDFNSAIDIFSRVIQMVPYRPSGYNNRAQAFRLLLREKEAMDDLKRAVQLSEEGGPASGSNLTRARALCQRALIYRKRGQLQLAREDLNNAAKLGSQFAKQQLVEINPYAAMCNQMLNQVMTKLYTTENGA